MHIQTTAFAGVVIILIFMLGYSLAHEYENFHRVYVKKKKKKKKKLLRTKKDDIIFYDSGCSFEPRF